MQKRSKWVVFIVLININIDLVLLPFIAGFFLAKENKFPTLVSICYITAVLETLSLLVLLSRVICRMGILRIHLRAMYIQFILPFIMIAVLYLMQGTKPAESILNYSLGCAQETYAKLYGFGLRSLRK
jgi:hypothetical protein